MLQILILKHLGVLVGGESIEEAFHLARSVMNAIDTQVRRFIIMIQDNKHIRRFIL